MARSSFVRRRTDALVLPYCRTGTAVLPAHERIWTAPTRDCRLPRARTASSTCPVLSCARPPSKRMHASAQADTLRPNPTHEAQAETLRPKPPHCTLRSLHASAASAETVAPTRHPSLRFTARECSERRDGSAHRALELEIHCTRAQRAPRR